MEDLTEQLFQSLDIIVGKRLEGIAYDKTILCTVLEVKDKDKGEYSVTDGTVTFLAYSDTKYSVNNKVYVTIPQGDYNNKKIIIGKYDEDDDQSYTVVKPRDRIVKIDTRTASNAVGLIANSSTQTAQVYALSSALRNIDYDKLAVSAKFRTDIEFDKAINITSGDYGIVITLAGIKNGTYTTEYLYLNTEDMIGNPYFYPTAIESQKLFDITGYTEIHTLTANFYQTKNSFKYLDGTVEQTYEVDDESNLFISEFTFDLGYGLSNYEESTAYIYTLDSDIYGEGSSAYTKNIQLRWIDSNGERMVSHEEYDPSDAYEVNWYQWILKNDIQDDEAGMFWRNIKDTTAISGLVLPTYDTTDLYNIEATISQQVNSSDIRLKAIIKVLNEDSTYSYYTSNIVTFTNSNPSTYEEAVDLIRGLSLSVTDSYKGIYNIYSPKGTLINTSESCTYRTISASYESIVTGYDYFDDPDDIIIWKIPKNNTMIEAPTKDKEYVESELISSTTETYGKYYDEAYYTFYRTINTEANVVTETLADDTETSAGDTICKNATQLFRIKSYYSQQETDNTVYCILLKNNKEYKAEIKLSFGNAGTNGTNYTLVLESAEDHNYIYNTANSTLRVRIKVVDGENKIVSAEPTLKWNSGGSGINITSDGTDSNGYYYYKLFVPTTIDNYTSTVLKCEATVSGVTLQSYMAIPINFSGVKMLYTGPDKIVYNQQGTQISYNSNPCQLYKYQTDNKELNSSAETVNWSASSSDSWIYPSISGNILKPCNIYISSNAIDGYYIKGSIGGSMVWIQPIIICQDNFENSFINAWDGTLKVDNESNTVASATMIAGTKNSNNQFTGVVIGKDNSTNSKAGLYGYSAGASSFAFREDGTAYIGKSGKGRIEFDGNKSVIKSSSWNENSENGLYFDIDDGIIKGKNAQIKFTRTGYYDYKQAEDLNADTFGTNKTSYYTLNTTDNTYTQCTSNSTYSENTVYYTRTTSTGTANAIFSSNSDDTYPLNINNNFKVGWNGAVQATAGYIGGWNILPNKLSGVYSNGRGVILSPSSGIVTQAAGATQVKAYTGVTVTALNDSGYASEKLDNKYVYYTRSGTQIIAKVTSYSYDETITTEYKYRPESYEMEFKDGVGTRKYLEITTDGNITGGTGDFVNLTVANTINGTCQKANQIGNYTAWWIGNHTHFFNCEALDDTAGTYWVYGPYDYKPSGTITLAKYIIKSTGNSITNGKTGAPGATTTPSYTIQTTVNFVYQKESITATVN